MCSSEGRFSGPGLVSVRRKLDAAPRSTTQELPASMPTCPNCGAAATDSGPFCQICGQHEPARLTIRGFFSHAFARTFSLDRGYLRTFVALSKSPGTVAKDFVEGRRAWYTNPLTYWLIAASAQLLALWSVQDTYLLFLEGSMRTSLEAQGESGVRALEQYQLLFQTEDPVPILSRLFLGAIKAAYSYMGVLFAMALAVFLNLFLRKRTGGYNTAEQLVFALYVIGHWALITSIIMPVTIRISPVLHGTIGTLGYFIVVVVASLDFHQEGAKGGLLSVLAMILAFAVFMVLIIVAVLVSLTYNVVQLN